MAGTPEEGQQSIGLDASLSSSFALRLKLYTNTIGTLTTTSVLADVTEADITNHPGYPATGRLLNLANFSVDADGTITYVPGEVFTATAPWTSVTGAAITDGTRLRHYSDFASPITLTTGQAIRIQMITEV